MKKIILGVEGMMCGMCESHVNDKVRKCDGVKKVTSSHSKRVTEVIVEDNANLEQIKNAITSQGYTIFSEQIENYVKKGFFW